MDRPASDAESGAINKLLLAYGRALAKDLAAASDGPRVFMILTAPSNRGGHCALTGNVREEDIDRFLQLVRRDQAGATSEWHDLEG